MGSAVNICFSCRSGWVAPETEKPMACPNCHGTKTAVTKQLKDAELRVPKDVFEHLVVVALKDPELRKVNAEYLPLFWRLKKI